MLPIRVILFDDSTLDISVGADTTVTAAKQLISEETQMKTENFILFYGDTELENKKLVTDYGISGDDCLQVARSTKNVAIEKLDQLGLKVNNEDFIKSIKQGDIEAISLYAETNCIDKYLSYGISVSIYEDHPSITKILVPKYSGHLCGFLNSACSYYDYDIAKYLLELGTDCTKMVVSGHPPLMTILYEKRRNCPKFVQLLISYGADCNWEYRNRTPLVLSIENGQSEYVDILIEAGADPNLVLKDGRAPLEIAIRNSNLDIAKKLIKAGAIIKAEYLLIVSNMRMLRKITSTFFKWFLTLEGVTVEVPSENTTALHFVSCREKGGSLLPDLINLGTDVNVVDESGATALYKSCEHEVEEACKILLKNGADVNICTTLQSRSPLFISCYNGNTTIVRLLLNAGALTSADDHHGRSPLFISSKRGYLKSVNLLLSNSVDVNHTDRYGKTPLYIACEHGHVDIVKALLREKSDVNTKDNINLATPLSVIAVDY